MQTFFNKEKKQNTRNYGTLLGESLFITAFWSWQNVHAEVCVD